MKNYKCHFCAKTFSFRQSLSQHISRVHQNKKKPHQCINCQYSFDSITELRRHVEDVENMHEGKKNHKCDSCDKRFSRKSLLRLHNERVHLAIKNYTCEICNHTFNQKSHFESHISFRHIKK